MRNRYLYFTVFFSGMSTLAIEFSASRLLGSAFGTSNLVWASIVGLILIYLTVGYFIGGKWADRSPSYRTLYTVLGWGALTAGFVPLLAGPVLTLAANAFDELQIGILLGSFTAVLILFSVPVTLLGTVSPFAIRLAISDAETAGRVSGQIYAISTLGSFIGTFLPVLVLIPLIGTRATFLTFSAGLLLVALLGQWLASGWRGVLRMAWMPVVLIALALLLGNRPIKNTVGQIYEAESAYNYIQVLEEGGYRYLRLNEGQGVHSVWHPDDLSYEGPWEQFHVGPFLNPGPYAPDRVQRIAIVGLAAGTVARQATAIFGPIPIDGIEIDPKIIEVGQNYFGLNQLPNLHPIVQDGRWALERSPEHYNLIAVDAYQPPYIPWQLTTQEFFQIAYNHLTQDGVLVINVGRSPQDRSLIDGLVGTVGSIFPSVYVMDIPNTFNSIIYATAQPTVIENLYNNYLYLSTRPEVHPLLLEAIQRTIVYQQPTPSSRVIYTDDWAPIEWLTNQLVLNYVFFGDIEELE